MDVSYESHMALARNGAWRQNTTTAPPAPPQRTTDVPADATFLNNFKNANSQIQYTDGKLENNGQWKQVKVTLISKKMKKRFSF